MVLKIMCCVVFIRRIANHIARAAVGLSREYFALLGQALVANDGLLVLSILFASIMTQYNVYHTQTDFGNVGLFVRPRTDWM